ncbi:DUF2691 family protein [Paenibacillus mesophilus]|uniref:DUF2691 family protein n=1 Tax=Paenibacillus mesophilus TaxID=2582849 RepID=UPI00110F5B2D|nr:DUF2691 family protein [Paenibacillus mesophilus]TMV43302.1 DUF2691 family protein [Paenibacillus mesophilus]
MKRGIQLEIPNEWGSHLGEVLEPFNISHFDWYIGGEEAYQDTAYPKDESIEDVLTYEEFLKSQCQLVLIVIDSSYLTVYCKDNKMIDDLYLNAIRKGFEKVEYITDENDFRTRLSVW